MGQLRKITEIIFREVDKGNLDKKTILNIVMKEIKGCVNPKIVKNLIDMEIDI